MTRSQTSRTPPPVTRSPAGRTPRSAVTSRAASGCQAVRGEGWMQALVKYAPGPGNVELRDVPEPELDRGAVLIAVAAVGVCGTDRQAIEGAEHFPTPRILGHEVSGVVQALGPETEADGLAVRDHVTLETDAYVCERVPLLLAGREQPVPASPGHRDDDGRRDGGADRDPAAERPPAAGRGLPRRRGADRAAFDRGPLGDRAGAAGGGRGRRGHGAGCGRAAGGRWRARWAPRS